MSNSAKSSTTIRNPDWSAWREQFPVLQDKTYLNSCSYGALADSVTAALHQYISDRQEKGTDWHYWVERNEAVRRLVAKLLGANDSEVAITASASAGMNAIASSLDYQHNRNKILISDFEFPTSGQIWHAQEMRGARIERVLARDGYIPVEDFAAAIDEETLLVAVTRVCYRNGSKLDVESIAEIARDRGALTMVDGYQAFGTEAFDVSKSNVDFAVGGMLKYLLGAAGIGFLYVRKALTERLTPTSTGWFAQENIFAMDHTQYAPASTARRFEMGTPPVPSCYASEAGLKIILEIGLPAIEGRMHEITSMLVNEAKAAGYKLAMPEDSNRRGPMIALQSHDENELVKRLENQGIVTSCRDGNLRMSPHFYNNEADVESLLRGLREHKHLLV